MKKQSERPKLDWEHVQHPPAAEKVIALTKFGVLVSGPVTNYDWTTGFIVCWQRCPARPPNWGVMCDSASRRAGA